MSYIKKIGEYADIADIAYELSQAPELWNSFKYRTYHSASPHRDTQDIWVRYNDFKNYDPQNPFAFNEEHESVWWPTVHYLPGVFVIANMMASYFQGQLGGVFVTKIPPGKCVHPHIDYGWHAKHYDKKVGISVQANENQSFSVLNERLVTKTGDIFEFDNSKVHWVNNDSSESRITVICAIKTKENVQSG